MLVSSRATVVSAAAPQRFLSNFKRISSVSIPSSFGFPLINDHGEKKINTTIGWSNYSYRMDKKKNLAFTCAAAASVAAQPLENADALIDSVETFIFDCDGTFLCFSC